MLRSLRKRLTYANVMASTAVFITLAGVSYAAVAKNSVGTAHLKSNAVTSAKIKNTTVAMTDLTAATRALINAAGPTGPAGPAGPAGNNATGATMGMLAITSAATRYAPLTGAGPGGGATLPAPGITPNVPLVLGDAAVHADGLTLMTELITFTVTLNGSTRR